MLTISEMMNKSPLSPDEDKLLFYSAAAVSMLGMISTIVWKAYKLCSGRKKYVVNHGFTEVVVVEPTAGRQVKPKEIVKLVESRSRPQGGTSEQVEHEITQL